MPKNKGKGGKNRRRGKNENDNDKRELIYKEDGQEYAQCLKMLGNGRLEAYCFDGQKRLCHIRGKLRKKVWINTGDIILIGLRDFQDSKADVIMKYYPEEARTLKAYGELPENVNVSEQNMDYTKEGEDIVEFDESAVVDGEDGDKASTDSEKSSDEDSDEEEDFAPKKGKAVKGKVSEDEFEFAEV